MKTIVVTGATRGIGRAVAWHFAANGFGVAVCSRSSANVRSFQREFAKRFPDNHLVASVCDVSKLNQVKRFAAAVSKEWDHVDVLVNNAGDFVDGGVLDSREGDFENLFAANVGSAFHMTRELIEPIKRSKKGHVFNMCSVASLGPYPNGALYGITKFALLGFSKSLRMELMPARIAVTAMIPGAIYTDSWADSGIPERRFMRPEEVAQLMFDIYSMPKRAVVEEVILRPMTGDV
jgi:short-subunit dehydrogenase